MPEWDEAFLSEGFTCELVGKVMSGSVCWENWENWEQIVLIRPVDAGMRRGSGLMGIDGC